MALAAGNLRHKADIISYPTPYDVANSPTVPTVVVSSYYVSIRATTQDGQQQMGGSVPIETVQIKGHWVDGITPGMRLVTDTYTYEIMSAIDEYGDRCALTMLGKRVAV